MGTIICVGEVSRCLKREHNGGIGVRGDGI